MSGDQELIPREVRIVFSAQELEWLQNQKDFAKALREAPKSAEGVCKLIDLGGALIAEKNRGKFRLGNLPVLF